MKRRVLLVDDEPVVLDVLRRQLSHSLNPEQYEMLFATSGQEALALMEQQPVDLIISDIRMPQMDGIALLTTVMEKYPQTARFILSGLPDRALIKSSLISTHQYFPKPCNEAVLTQAIRRTCELRNILQKDELARAVAQIKALPAMPGLFSRVLQELKSQDASMQQIGEIIARDVGMSAKVLQLVNSSFFGLSRKVESPAHAVAMLGMEMVKAIVLMTQSFAQTNMPRAKGFSMGRLWEHSLLSAQCAMAIARKSCPDKKTVDEAFMSAMLHDVGKLILVTNQPEMFESIMALMTKERIPMLEAERRILHATHGELGGYLLGLWGFSEPVIEACIFHFRPGETSCERFGSLASVHVANAMVNRFQPDRGNPHAADLDMDFLRRLKVEDRVSEWETLCRGICQQKDPV